MSLLNTIGQAIVFAFAADLFLNTDFQEWFVKASALSSQFVAQCAVEWLKYYRV